MVGWLGAMPQSATALGQMQTVSEPFVWGQGGSRMTPEDIAFQRRLAAEQGRMDYSPLGHWTQGLSRAFDNVGGALRENRADQAAADNAAYSASVAEALLNGGGGASASIERALIDPNVSDDVKALAKMRWERLNPKPQQPTDFQQNYQWLQGLNPKFAQQYLQGKIDPEIVVPTPSGPYVGPRSQLSATIGEGGDPPVSGSVGGTPPAAPTQSGYADLGSAGQLIQSMGAKGFLDWQQRHGTPVMVRGPEEMAKLPPGTKVVSPDGRIGVKK